MMVSGVKEVGGGNLFLKSAIFDRSLPARRNDAIPIIESLSNSCNALIIRHNVRWYRVMGLLCFIKEIHTHTLHTNIYKLCFQRGGY